MFIKAVGCEDKYCCPLRCCTVLIGKYLQSCRRIFIKLILGIKPLLVLYLLTKEALVSFERSVNIRQ